MLRRPLACEVAAAEAAALEHITVTVRLAGWPEPGAREVARLMVARGVTPAAAAQSFYAAENRIT